MWTVEQERVTEKKSAFRLLVQFPNGHIRTKVGWNQELRTPSGSPVWVTGRQLLKPSPAAFGGSASGTWNLTRPRCIPRGGGLACCATSSAPKCIFLVSKGRESGSREASWSHCLISSPLVRSISYLGYHPLYFPSQSLEAGAQEYNLFIIIFLAIQLKKFLNAFKKRNPENFHYWFILKWPRMLGLSRGGFPHGWQGSKYTSHPPLLLGISKKWTGRRVVRTCTGTQIKYQCHNSKLTHNVSPKMRSFKPLGWYNCRSKQPGIAAPEEQ